MLPIWPTPHFIGFLHEHNMTYGTSMYRVHPWTSSELNATLMGQDDLFGALETKLGHSSLIRISHLCCGIWRSNLHQIIPWGWPYMSISTLGHDDLLGDMVVRV